MPYQPNEQDNKGVRFPKKKELTCGPRGSESKTQRENEKATRQTKKGADSSMARSDVKKSCDAKHRITRAKDSFSQPVREAVSYRGLFTVDWFGVREKYYFWLKIYDRLRASEQAECCARWTAQARQHQPCPRL